MIRIKHQHLKENIHYSETQFIQKLKDLEKKLSTQRFDSNEKTATNWILDSIYDKENEEDLAKKNIAKDSFIYYFQKWNNFISEISNHLNRYHIPIEKCDETIFWKSYLNNIYNIEDNLNHALIYPKDGGLGWILDFQTGKIEFFEGTDEPLTKDDLMFEDAFTPSKDIILYSIQDYDFVQSWQNKGIPENVFFATTEKFARNHWHTVGNDVLITITINNKLLQRTDEYTYQTIKYIDKNKFKLKIIG